MSIQWSGLGPDGNGYQEEQQIGHEDRECKQVYRERHKPATGEAVILSRAFDVKGLEAANIYCCFLHTE